MHDTSVLGKREQSAAFDPADFASYPTRLDAAYERFDLDSALRPTIIQPDSNWTKRAQKALLEPPITTKLTSSDLDKEKNAVFDLLDAITCSGALGIAHASFHVVIAATHGFDASIMDTVIKKNVNPIERVERSVLIMSRCVMYTTDNMPTWMPQFYHFPLITCSTIHNKPMDELVQEEQLARVQAYSPMLFIAE